METPIRLTCCQTHIYPGFPEEKEAIVQAIDIRSDGHFNYQYNHREGPRFIIGRTSEPVLQQLCTEIPKAPLIRIWLASVR